jgi:tetratricopeptide (TPR) repeat protein
MAVERTIRELRYNLGEAYQDDDRHLEAHAIFRELYAADRDEQRFAVRLFASCQALGMTAEMRAIVEDLDGRRRALFEAAKTRVAELRKLAAERLGPERAEGRKDSQLSDQEKEELEKWRNLARYQLPVIDYLKAQVLTAEKRYREALAALQPVTSARVARPGLFLQTADLYLRLRRFRDAEQVYRKALAIDPDNVHAHVGLCRIALRKRQFEPAAQSALDALQRIYHYPMAHFLLGSALAGLEDYARAAEAMRKAISFNPNFPEAHLQLAGLLEKHLGDAATAREHRRLARRMRRGTPAPGVPPSGESRASVRAQSGIPAAAATGMPPVEECLIVVTGLPRSGTSMIMQMLVAGGLGVMTDGLREADEDNPRGYLEYEPVKNLLQDSEWLGHGRGKAVKIVAPLLGSLPRELPCRIILSERDLDEVLDSQARMLARRNQALPATSERRRLLREEYARMLGRVKAALARRPLTQVLVVEHASAMGDALSTAERVNAFLGGALDKEKMAAAIDPALHRNRSVEK